MKKMMIAFLICFTSILANAQTAVEKIQKAEKHLIELVKAEKSTNPFDN